MNITDVWALVKEHWELAAGVFALIVALATGFRMRSAWAKRNFLSRVNFSLNYVDGNTLRIRTLQESDLDQILLNNRHGKRIVFRAIKHTSLEKPFLEFPDADRWVVLNAILNELSEQFARGFVAISMGVPVTTATYLFGVTCERDPRVRLNKVRVMLIEKSLLEGLDEIADDLTFERESHAVRLETLRRMKEIYSDEKRRKNLFEVELAIDGVAALASD